MNIKSNLIFEINNKLINNFNVLEAENLTVDTSLEDIIALKNKLFEFQNIHVMSGVELTQLITLVIDLENFYSFKSLGQSTIGAYHQSKVEELSSNFQSHFRLSILQNEITQTLKEFSGESYFVGGAVRDACNKIAPNDIDFCTTIPVDNLISVFESKGYRCKKGRFDKIIFLSKKNTNNQKENFEISIIEDGDLFKDVKNRDFTINSGYVRISDGLLCDVSGAFVDDLINSRLTFGVNALEKLDKDPVRVLRFMRFVSKGFSPEKDDLKLVRRLWSESLSKVKPEIVRLEMEKMNGLI